MNIYHYDATGAYLGADVADPDPLVKGRWLIPANATHIAPPNAVEGNLRVFRNGAWGYVLVTTPEEEPQPDPVPPPPPTFEELFPPLDPLDFKLAMLTLNVTPDDVDAAIDAMPEPDRTLAKIYWTSAGKFRRDNPLIEQIAAAFGKTSADIDSAWAYARESVDG
jgi:hypothetical protein